MNQDQKEIKEILNKIIGQKVAVVALGHGSFLTIDFGKLISKVKKLKNREVTHTFGEWHLWVYMCSWRIDKDNKPFIASNDPREKIAAKIQEIAGTIITKYEILNSSLDAKFYFGASLTLTLFNASTDIDENEEQWMFFTPDKKVLIIGPGDIWDYHLSLKNHTLQDVKRLWMSFDPIGVYGLGSDWSDDEYDAYIVPTLNLLKDGASFDALKNYITSVVHDHMGIGGINSIAIDDFVTKLLKL